MGSYAACIERHCPHRHSCLRYRTAFRPATYASYVIVPPLGAGCTLHIDTRSPTIPPSELVDERLDLAQIDAELILHDIIEDGET